MNDDQGFRLFLVLVLSVLLPIALYHRLKSQATREKLDRLQEGVFLLVSIRLFGLGAWIGLLVFLIDPSWMAWSSVPLPVWLRWIGAGLGAVTVLLLLWTFHVLGKNLTDTVVTRQHHTLVTTGPYHWVRHPFYISVALFNVVVFF
jgi:protein-S-isoprenylcysteine O-methyltransferase Ste14